MKQDRLGNAPLRTIVFEGKAGGVSRRALLPGVGLHKVVSGMKDPGAERCHLVMAKGECFVITHNKSVEGNVLGEAGNRAQRFEAWALAGFKSNHPSKEKWMDGVFHFKATPEQVDVLFRKAQSNKESVVLKTRKAIQASKKAQIL